MNTATTATTQGPEPLFELIDEWYAWCAEQGLECRSADEMDREHLTQEQRDYIDAFIARWDRA